MDEIASTPQQEAWTPGLPFSKRVNEFSEPVHVEVVAQATTEPPVAAADETPTSPIIMPSLKASTVPVRGFRALSPDELSAEELRQVNLQITAFIHAQVLLKQSGRAEAPQRYAERFFVWKMLFTQLIPAGSLAVMLFVTVLGAQMIGGVSGWTVLVMSLSVLVYGWFALRIYRTWSSTILFSEERETGIRRKRNRWLLLTEINPTVETASIQTKSADRNHFTSFFNINSWQISLDAPAQKDDFLQGIGFVRDGDRLKKTVNDWQRYLN